MEQNSRGADFQRRQTWIPEGHEILTREHLRAIAAHASEKAIDLFLPYINKYAVEYEITSVQRMAAFLAQVLHESGELRYVRELWGPTPQQRKYERDFKAPWHNKLTPKDRNYVAYNLGNTQAGDGSFFKGHGLIQVTGRTNHLACSKGIFGDDKLLSAPELLTVPEYAVLSAMWYWKSRNINRAADTPGILDETRLVNGGKNGLADRQRIYNIAIAALVYFQT